MRDDEAAIRLLCAVVLIARRDARKGNLAARDWLRALERCRPNKVRLLGSVH